MAESPLSESNSGVSLQASDTHPVNDDRIAALFAVDSKTGQERRSCTASYLSNSFWLTAKHCSPKSGDFLKQTDGEKAKVEKVHFYSDSDDLALMEVGHGIEAKPFELPASMPEVGEELTFIGYGSTHNYASIAKFKVKNFVESYPPELGIPYQKLMVVSSTTPSRTCEGDSGGPSYKNNTIYSVHTAGGTNLECTDGQDSLAWMTPLTQERTKWIESHLSGWTENARPEGKSTSSYKGACLTEAPTSLELALSKYKHYAVISEEYSTLKCPRFCFV